MMLPAHLRRIFPLWIAGLTARQIAMKEGLAIRTVQSYTQAIYEIYDVHSRRELRAKA